LIHFDFVSSQPISRNPAWQVPTVPPKRLSSIIILAHMQSRWWRREHFDVGATGAFVSGPNRRCSTTLEQSPRAVVEQGFEIWRARYLKNDFESIKPRPCRHAGGRDVLRKSRKEGAPRLFGWKQADSRQRVPKDTCGKLAAWRGIDGGWWCESVASFMWGGVKKISRREVSVTLGIPKFTRRKTQTRTGTGTGPVPVGKSTSATAFQSLLLHALSSHLHALAVAVRAPRRDFSLASHGPSQGPQHMPEFFPCCIVPAATDVPLTAEPMAVIRKLRCWDPFVGRRRLERVRCRSR